jgi:hypothetical protein
MDESVLALANQPTDKQGWTGTVNQTLNNNRQLPVLSRVEGSCLESHFHCEPHLTNM